MPQDLSKLYLLQNLSVALFIIAGICALCSTWLYLSAYGGIGSLIGRITHKRLLKQQVVSEQDGDLRMNENDYEAPMDVLARTEDIAEQESIEETQPVEVKAGGVKEISEEEADDPTGVLSTRQETAPFRITKKITITHESEGEGR